MNHSMIYPLIPMFVISLFFVGIGLMVLIRKKPVILNYNGNVRYAAYSYLAIIARRWIISTQYFYASVVGQFTNHKKL